MSQAKVVKFLLLGLPLGLILLGGGSLFLYETPVAQQRLRDFGAQSQSIKQEDLMKAVRDFSEVIGPRSRSLPEKRKQAATFIESTLGPHNAGYQIERSSLVLADGTSTETLVAQQKGHRLANDIVLVSAHYDSAESSPGANDNATGMSAIFGLAQSLIGHPHERTLRFVAFGDGAEGKCESAFHYAEGCQARGERILAVVCLDSLGWFSSEKAEDFPPSLRETLPSTADFVAILGQPSSAELVNRVGELMARGLDLSVQRGICSGAGEEEILRRGLAPFGKRSWPSVLITSGGSLRLSPRRDSPAMIDIDQFTKVVMALNRTIYMLANPRS